MRLIDRRCAPLFVLVALAAPAAAQQDHASRRFWTSVDEAALPAGAVPRELVAGRFQTLALDVAGMREYLKGAPPESSKSAPLVLELPLPSGGFGRFTAVESPIMERSLQERFPEIRTYRGQGLDDRTATIRFDLTPRGFHALVLSEGGTLLIDPRRPGDDRHYVAYYKRDLQGGQRFNCLFRGTSAPDARPGDVDVFPNGDTLRQYRLALAADGEYSVRVCLPDPPDVSCAFAEMTTAMNRVNGVYERDLAVRMNFIANETSIIYLDGTTDPYTNNNGSAMLGQNQTNLDTVIGSANYDIGHVFSTGGGGIAGLGVVCVNGQKAHGVTGLSNPVGDTFYIDYVAHEMGHQFRGNHSFNGTTGSCGGGNRNASTAWEPGSGSTIMAYAGICGAENVQPHSDDYFHAGNLIEMSTYIQSQAGSTCSANSASGNGIPTASAGADISVPAQTPFTLTASGSDPDGDSITFNWEELDIGAAAPPNTDNGNRAIFRSYDSTAGPARTLPALQYILDNDNAPPAVPVSESLPTTTRSMQFRATVRDNHSGAGAVASDLMLVNVTSTSGPFKVTDPDTPITWTEGTTPTVSWNVANTNAAPVSCASVNILLSVDGGSTFPTSLASGTPNDGSEVVTVPNGATSTARVKVECASSPFFDISNTNFTIAPVPVELQQLSIQ